MGCNCVTSYTGMPCNCPVNLPIEPISSSGSKFKLSQEESAKMVKEILEEFNPRKIEEELLQEAMLPEKDFLEGKALPLRGTKLNNGKPPMHLVSGEFVKGMAEVLAFGAKKYGEYNWLKGIPITELYDSAERHTLDFKDGITYDQESGIHQAFHAAVNWMMIYITMKEKPELDDRYKK